MKKKSLLYLLAICGLLCSTTAYGQGETVQEEEVEGISNVLGYFGKKLGKELGSRLNLDESDTTEVVMVPTKVKVKIGPFTMEKTEYRPKVVNRDSDQARREDT